MQVLQSLNVDTPIHRLSPLTKLYALLWLFGVILVSFNLFVLLAIMAYCLVFWVLARISLVHFKSLLATVGAVSLFFIIANGFFYYGGSTLLFALPLWRWNLTFTLEGLIFGVAVACKIAASISAFPILTMTTPISRLMAALAYIRLPYKIIFAFGTAIRFVPLMQQTWHDILDAQRLRAHDLTRMRLPTRLWRGYLPIAVPFLLTLLRKSQDLDVAIESRAFGAPVKRTYLDDIGLHPPDWIVIVLTTLFCGGLITASLLLGWGAGLLGMGHLIR